MFLARLARCLAERLRVFFARGFDAVTVEEIAIAAKVSKMTVFNYLARKEELFLDREDGLKLLPLRKALHGMPKNQSPVDALRNFVQGMSDQKHPLCHINGQMVRWWHVLDASPPLKARLRELSDEAAAGLAIKLGGPKPDGLIRLTAGVIVLTVRTAREEAIRLIERGAATKKANAAFLAQMERGLSVVEQLLVSES